MKPKKRAVLWRIHTKRKHIPKSGVIGTNMGRLNLSPMVKTAAKTMIQELFSIPIQTSSMATVLYYSTIRLDNVLFEP